MKGITILLSLLMVTSACSRWPSLYVGNSSGRLQYDRRTGVLMVEWQHSATIHGEPSDTTAVVLK